MNTLTCTLTTKHLRLESFIMIGGFRDKKGHQMAHQGNRGLTEVPFMMEVGGGESIHTGRESVQEVVANPSTIPSLQVGPGFKLRLDMCMFD